MVFALLLQGLQDDTITTLLEAVSWSLNVLEDGHWPSRDHKGRPLVGKRAGRQGPLADGYFAVATEHLGDWKYVKEVFPQCILWKNHPPATSASAASVRAPGISLITLLKGLLMETCVASGGPAPRTPKLIVDH